MNEHDHRIAITNSLRKSFVLRNYRLRNAFDFVYFVRRFVFHELIG